MKAFFAGAENKQWSIVLEKEQVKNRFFSYYYTRKSKDDTKSLKYNFSKSDILIVDSGAHTFFSESDQSLTASVHKKKSKTKESSDEYWEKYLEWLIRNKNHLTYFVELDIGELVGQKKVIAWRKQLDKHGLLNKCITVCHPAVTSYETYLRELNESQSKYVAIEGLRPGQPQIPYGKYVLAAHKNNIKIHGFALTNQSIVSRYPFYSVDSTSWLAPLKFGSIQYMNKGRISSVNSKDKKLLAQRVRTSSTCYNSSISRVDQSYTLLHNSIAALKHFENYYTRLWAKRGIVWED